MLAAQIAADIPNKICIIQSLLISVKGEMMKASANFRAWATAIVAGICLSPFAAIAAPSQNTYGVGIEGFHDTYKEPDVDLTDTTNYGSMTAYYNRQLSQKLFFAVDGRVSYGTDDYSSPSGTLSGVPQWETELRARVGTTVSALGGALSPYTGLGWRYFLDKGKGYTSSLGEQAYDRRISQFYIPVGASLAYYTDSGWSVTPLAEADLMFYGDVDTRLTNITQGPFQYLNNPDNTQHFGIGLRSELMFGKTMGDYTIQAGPFVRYWYVNKSDTYTYFVANGNTPDYTKPAEDLYEPKNNRTQLGVAMRVLF